MYNAFHSNETAEISQIQIEKGNVATEYEAYSGKTYNIYLDEPLRKVGDTVDYIDLKKGKVIRNVKELEIKSDKVYAKYDYRENNGIFWSLVLDSKKNREIGLCNREDKVGAYYLENSHYMWIGAENQAVYWIGILDALNLSTVDEFKTWLDSNSTYIYYAKENLPSEDINNLSEIFTKNGQNIVRIGTNVDPSKFEIIYDKNV